MTFSTLFLTFTICLMICLSVSHGYEYGLDVSFPIIGKMRSDAPAEFRKNYDNFINGCVSRFGNSCIKNDKARLDHNRAQPPVEYNYTTVGFKKIRAPESAMKILSSVFERDFKQSTKVEQWPDAAIYVNHWESSSIMVDLTAKQRKDVQDAVKPIIADWVGFPVVPTSIYGIRAYTNGAILSPHVDRLPLVSSCIINVAQDVDEDWVLEVYDHGGKAHNVTMAPGDLVLYESHTVNHGRPFPLKGRYYANIFVHFKPVGHDDRRDEYFESLEKSDPFRRSFRRTEETKFKDAPANWSWLRDTVRAMSISAIEDALPSDKAERLELLNYHDPNGWQVLHEAIRAGDKDVVELLIEKGADVNARVNPYTTTLSLARSLLHDNHEVIDILLREGARE